MYFSATSRVRSVDASSARTTSRLSYVRASALSTASPTTAAWLYVGIMMLTSGCDGTWRSRMSTRRDHGDELRRVGLHSRAPAGESGSRPDLERDRAVAEYAHSGGHAMACREDAIANF